MTTLTADDMASAIPDTESELTLSGLDARIAVFRDRHGIPRIRAESARDAFFGQGFATAQDRLWHMDCDRARARGRWAELVGASGLEHDKTMRRFQIAPSVERDWTALSQDARDMFEAYSAGVNAFIASARALPVEYSLIGARPERWEPRDCLAVFKVRHIMMGVFEGKTWRARLVSEFGAERAARLFKGYQPGQLVIAPPGDEYDGDFLDGAEDMQKCLAAVEWAEDADAGSNNWAVHGSRTASGKPLVAGDPHRGLDTPNVYYQNQIACPEFDVIGLSFPGCPGFPHFGHNANVAWCVTHAGADYQDLYAEKTRAAAGGGVEYLYKDEWKAGEVRREIIRVRGGADEEIEVRVTEHGPIIAQSADGSRGLAFKYTATAAPNLGFESVRQMLYAQDADALDESMREWVDPCNNFVFADVHGDIGYLNRGQVPIRPMANAWLPVPGWTGEYEWRGMIPFEELARIRNPRDGVIVTANNRIVNADYPHYIALDFAPDYRAQRIFDRLSELDKATVEDMAAIHADAVSIPAQVYSRFIANMDAPDDDWAAACRRVLLDWDGDMSRDLVAPTIYSAIRSELQGIVYSGILGGLYEDAISANGRGAPGHLRQLASLIVSDLWSGRASLASPDGETPDWGALIDHVMGSPIIFENIRRKLGEDMSAWTWGSVHHTSPEHPLSAAFPDAAHLLNPPSFAVSGDGDTPRAGSYAAPQLYGGENGGGAPGPFTVSGTSVARYVWDTADWDNSRWIVPLGASGHPGSPHYADQAATWADVGLIPATYSWDRIERESESVQIIIPAPPDGDGETSETAESAAQDSQDAAPAAEMESGARRADVESESESAETAESESAAQDVAAPAAGMDSAARYADAESAGTAESESAAQDAAAQDSPAPETADSDDGGDYSPAPTSAPGAMVAEDSEEAERYEFAAAAESAPAPPPPALYEGSRAEYGVRVERGVMVEMRDGALMATDLYFPALNGARAAGRFPVILERTPYDKSAARQTSRAKFFARRGYVAVIQDVRGRFASEGEWIPFSEEAEDGFDTVEWLGVQEWSVGKVGTMGDSYAGSDQAALATLDPPHLATMIVAVGASNYFSSSMRQNGALEQRFLIYSYRMAVDSPEAVADPSLRAALRDIFENGMPEVVDKFPIIEGASILRRVPGVERWAIDLQTRGEYDDYWKRRGYAPSEYYAEHADVPTLYLGGWYDSYARNTTESYAKLSRLKESPQRLLMGPWTHGQYEVTHAGDIDFGLDSHIDYNDLKLAWFDHHLKGMRTAVADWSAVQIFTMGGGDGAINGERRLNHGGAWRGAADWPPPGTRFIPHYFHADGGLSRDEPRADERPSTSYVFDPSDPVPTVGGGISAANPIMEPGAYDQRGDPTRFYGSEDHQPLNARADVLTFQTPELDADVEVTGPITVKLWVSSSAPDTDFTAKLIDVYPPRADYPEGLAINITDSIIRARYRNGFAAPEFMEPGEIYELEFQLYPTSNLFAAGHRIRVDISSSNWPRFDVNHNTGGSLGVDRTYEAALQTLHHAPGAASRIILPIAGGAEVGE